MVDHKMTERERRRAKIEQDLKEIERLEREEAESEDEMLG